jgi:hypothetical protein
MNLQVAYQHENVELGKIAAVKNCKNRTEVTFDADSHACAHAHHPTEPDGATHEAMNGNKKGVVLRAS